MGCRFLINPSFPVIGSEWEQYFLIHRFLWLMFKKKAYLPYGIVAVRKVALPKI